MQEFDIDPYMYNLVYDYDNFLDAVNGTDVLKNKFIKHSSRVMAELIIVLPNLDFDTSEKVESIITSYLKMQTEIISPSIY